MGTLYAAEAAAPVAAETKEAEKAAEHVVATASQDEKKPDTAQEPYKAPTKVSISPAIPMGGVEVMTETQYENNKKDLETVTNAIQAFAEYKGESTKGDKEQENLLKERQAYLSFTVKSYESYHKSDTEEPASDEIE